VCSLPGKGLAGTAGEEGRVVERQWDDEKCRRIMDSIVSKYNNGTEELNHFGDLVDAIETYFSHRPEKPLFTMQCSFCGSSDWQLIIGPQVSICVECAVKAHDIVEEIRKNAGDYNSSKKSNA
jgi:hypothetical protein